MRRRLPDLTSVMADRLFALSNVALVVGAVLALLGTLGTFWTGGIRDRYSDERLHQAEVRVAEANQSAAAATERAAQSEKEAALAKLQTEKLKQQVAWRQLSAQQEDEIASKLTAIDLPFDFVWVGSDAESQFFAESLKGAFVKAKLKVRSFAPAMFLGVQPPTGVGLNGPQATVDIVVKTLTDVGVLAVSRVAKDSPADAITVVVGPRPPLSPR